MEAARSEGGFCSEESRGCESPPAGPAIDGDQVVNTVGLGAEGMHVLDHVNEAIAEKDLEELEKEELQHVARPLRAPTAAEPLVMTDTGLVDPLQRATGPRPIPRALQEARDEVRSMKGMGNVLTGVAVGAEMNEAVHETTAMTGLGKAADVADAGLMALGTMGSGLGPLDGVMGVAGGVLGAVGSAAHSEGMIGAGEWLDHNKPSRQLIGAGRGVINLVEGAITGESAGMGKIHEQQVDGDYGVPLQGSAMLGDFLADHPVDHLEADAENGLEAMMGPFAHYAD